MAKDMLHGFTLEREAEVPEISSTVRLYRHQRTGARLMSVAAPDENKVFGITFRTPPKDSTGVAHILEHSVLCGSDKYPVKEPFVELLKGSLQTFLNAFTYPDKTCYPVASTNLRDFYNLIDVYLDAVFHPRLTEQVLEQEGWHHELDDPAGPMSYKGVVFNEMKGVYSSPDSLIAEYSQQALFPDTTYGLDSGGDPEIIPQLTFEAFMDFHRRYYHPSNAWIFFYGDDDPHERLRIMDSVLAGYEARPVDSDVGLQRRKKAPERVTRRYAAGEDEHRHMVTLNWLLCPTDQAELNLSLQILEHILIGMPSSPLRKALIDSGLGEDLAGVGLETELRQMYFSVGLKGMRQGAEGQVEAIILDTLQNLASGGIGADMIEAAVNSVEFELRELNTGRFPRGLAIMLHSLTTWLYDADPLALVAFEAPLSAIKQRLADGEPLFESLVRARFLDNPHRVSVLLEPDHKLAQERQEREQNRLAQALEAMDEGQRKALVRDNEALRARQEAPDAPEALARIPRLAVADLPRENTRIPCQRDSLAGIETLFHDLPTNAIAYVDVGLNLAGLPQDRLPCVPLFGRALLEMGTGRRDFVALTRRIASRTGGIEPMPWAGAMEGADQAVSWLFLRGKATVDRAGDLMDLLTEVLTEARLDDQERFRKMVLEEKARAEQRLVPSGHLIVASRLRAAMTRSGWVGEQFAGVENLLFLRWLTEAVDNDWPRVHAMLEEMRELLVRRGNMILNATMDSQAWSSVRKAATTFAEAMPTGGTEAAPLSPQALHQAEGLTIPAQVNYVGRGAYLTGAGYEITGSDLVVSRWLRTAYLWDRVRVQGGAYGAFCLLDRLNGTIIMASYRDPNLERTLGVFAEAADFLHTLELPPDELTKAIVGAIGDFDAYQLPDAKGFTSLARHLQGVTEERLQEVREEILAATADSFKRLGDAAAILRDQGRTAVLGRQDALAGLKEPALTLTKVL